LADIVSCDIVRMMSTSSIFAKNGIDSIRIKLNLHLTTNYKVEFIFYVPDLK
jgi:hypothetical protein